MKLSKKFVIHFLTTLKAVTRRNFAIIPWRKNIAFVWNLNTPVWCVELYGNVKNIFVRERIIERIFEKMTFLSFEYSNNPKSWNSQLFDHSDNSRRWSRRFFDYLNNLKSVKIRLVEYQLCNSKSWNIRLIEYSKDSETWNIRLSEHSIIREIGMVGYTNIRTSELCKNSISRILE